MKFLSDILAKAGLTVDGVVTLNNTATGQTPATNDNSTKLATTAWVRGFVTPYSLPIASGTTLGGIKIGSGLAIDGSGIVSVAASGVGAIRALQQITATAGQTVFTVSGGYTPGLIDIFLNGVLLTPTSITATNGSSFTLEDPAVSGDLLDIFVYNPIYNGFISSTDQVPEGITNLYYTNTRARTAISLTTTGVSGAASYDNATGVLNIPNYQGLVPANGLAGQILAKASTTSYDTTWIDNYTSQVQHYVKLSTAMTAGTAVYVSGSTGGSGTNMLVSKASNTSEATSSKTLGLIKTGGIANDQVFVVTEGLIAGLDTSTATIGDPVWLGTNGSLIFGLTNKPTAPAHLVFIGVVTRVQSNNGEIFVKVQNGFELDELHNLSVANASDGDMIKYVASTGLWTKITASTTNIVEGTNLYYTQGRFDTAFGAKSTSNLAEGTNLYYTDTRVDTYLTANNYATKSYVSSAISGLVGAAPATLDTLNELAAALGNDANFATTVTNSIGTKVPLTRTITINGTSYDLSADRTWNIAAGVTSFNTRTGAITPTAGDYTTAQVTESGNLYYTDARARLAISLTTTGTSGAATYDNVTGILNIPQYQGGVTSFNTRTGAITLSSGDVTTALTYTPVTNARTITINGTSYDLSADRTWSIAAGLTSFNTRTGDITLTSSDVTTALGYTPVTNARTLTINGTAYDLTADRSWTVGVNPSARTIQTYTATASQTTFTVTGGYVAGLVDVFINGVRLTSADFTATDGSTVVLTTGTGAGNIVDVIKYTSAFTASNALRQVSYFTATAGQTSFTVNYTPGLVDVFYNGSKLASSEYTAANGTSIVLTSGATLNDTIEVVAYAYSVGAFTGQAQLNGTGFVKVNGTTITYDNSTYLTTSSAASTYLALSGGTLTGALSGTSATFSGNVSSGGFLGLQIYNAGSNGAAQMSFKQPGQEWLLNIRTDAQFSLYNLTAGTTPFLINTSGAATFSNDVTLGGNESYLYLSSNYLVGANTRAKIRTVGAGGGSGYGGDLRFSTRTPSNTWNEDAMTITSAGNVGIGLASPSYKLDVNGVIRSNNTNTSAGDLYLGNTPAGVAYAAGAVRGSQSGYSYTGKLSFYVTTWGAGSDYGLTEQMYIETSGPDTKNAKIVMSPWGGNVGIGTTTPYSGLHVARAGNLNGGSLLLGLGTSGAAKWSYLTGAHYNQTTGSGNGAGSAGIALIGSYGGSTNNDVYIGGGPYEINAATTLLFYTHTSTTSTAGGTERMRITSGGNLGVGMTDPQQKIQTGGRIRISPDNSNGGDLGVNDGGLALSTIGATPIQFWTNNYATQTFKVASNGDIYANNNAALFFGASALTYLAGGNTSMTLAVNGSTAMTINSSRNVGIGTSSPTDKLDVAGEVVFGPQTEKLSIGSASLAWNRKVATGLIYDSSRFAYQFQHTGSTSSGSDYLALQVYSPGGGTVNSTALVVNGVANVGIGTASPSHRLQVSGNIYSTDTVFARNLKPEAWASVSAGSPSAGGIPFGYSTINITSPCDNNWRTILSNINDVKGYFWVTLGDAASKDTANYMMAMTSPAYGVSNFGNVSYQDNGWNTGGFEFTTSSANGTYSLLVRCTSYYSSGATAYGTIYFLRLE